MIKRKQRRMKVNCGVAIDIGVQNFEKIRERNSFYVDKTDFIKEWWENGADVTLITRPRRFGKTLNLSMLECFFSNQYEGRGELFEGLSIWKEEKYKRLQGTYPVIFLSFASIKSGEPARIKIAIKQVISNIYKSFQYMMESEIFDCGDRKYYSSVNDDMSDETVYIAINRLCFYLERYYGRKTILLLDEYDTPMQEAWLNGCWEEAVSFFRSFFNAAFKTNPHMERGLITGITRISKESIFSDLNNPEVITTTSGKYARYFGFTEQEVFQALDDMGFGAEKEGVKSWYDGFTFGSMTDIYNPWSIMSFMANGGRYQSYWADTSSNGLVNRLIREGSAGIKRQFERLIGGKSILVPVDEQKVQLAATLVHNPDIVILDEPFSGLDPVNSQILKDVVNELIRDGRLVIFSSHQMSYVEEFCDNIAIINQGEVVLDGELREIKKEYGRNRLMLAAENLTLEELREKVDKEWQELAVVSGKKKEFLILELQQGKERRMVLEKLAVSDIIVDKFGSYEPALNDIFVMKAGEQE